MRKQLTAKKRRSKAVSVCAALLITAVTLTGCGDTDTATEERSPILEDADRTNNLPFNQEENQNEESQEEEVKEEKLLSENDDSEEAGV